MDRFERYVGKLSDAEVLALHRIVCRRAAFIYEPLYRSKRDANYGTAMSIGRGGKFVYAGSRTP